MLLAVISRISESGADDDLASLIMDCGLGLLFLIMGNYMPEISPERCDRDSCEVDAGK